MARVQSVGTWDMLCEQRSSLPRRGLRSSQRMHFLWNDSSTTAALPWVRARPRSAVATANPSRTAIPEE